MFSYCCAVKGLKPSVFECTCVRDVNSREIAFPGRESQFPDLDRDSQFHPSTKYFYLRDHSRVGSPAGARRRGDDRRPVGPDAVPGML